MKYLLVSALMLMSIFSFSQEKKEQSNQLQLLTATGINGNFNTVYTRLDAISKNITETTVLLKREDEIRQGQLIISTENWGSTFNTKNLDTRPSLNIEAQNVMFTGNFINPNNPQGCIRIE